MADMKTYQVEYLISMKDEASTVLSNLAKTARDLQSPLQMVSESVQKISTSITSLRNTFKEEMILRPSLDINFIKGQFEELELLSASVARNISRNMSKAISGANLKTATKTDEEIMQTLQKRIDSNKSIIDSGTRLENEIKAAKGN